MAGSGLDKEFFETKILIDLGSNPRIPPQSMANAIKQNNKRINVSIGMGGVNWRGREAEPSKSLLMAR